MSNALHWHVQGWMDLMALAMSYAMATYLYTVWGSVHGPSPSLK
jgi:hypothetical protein